MEQPEQNSTPEASVEIPSESTAAAEQTLPKESRTSHFFKTALRWLFGILIVFGLGALTVIFLLYTPTRQTLQQTQAELTAANQKITDLENQVQKLSALENKNTALQKELDASVLHIKLLKALADVDSARLALAGNDPAAAKNALSNTASTIKDIDTLAGSSQSEAVKFIQDRLNLVLSEIDTDVATAQTDLGVIATKILELEKALFSQ